MEFLKNDHLILKKKSFIKTSLLQKSPLLETRIKIIKLIKSIR